MTLALYAGLAAGLIGAYVASVGPARAHPATVVFLAAATAVVVWEIQTVRRALAEDTDASVSPLPRLGASCATWPTQPFREYRLDVRFRGSPVGSHRIDGDCLASGQVAARFYQLEPDDLTVLVEVRLHRDAAGAYLPEILAWDGDAWGVAHARGDTPEDVVEVHSRLGLAATLTPRPE